KLDPFPSAVRSKEQSELGAGEEKIRIYRVFGKCEDRTVGGKISFHRHPGSSGVGAPQEIRRKIRVLMMVEGGKYRRRIMLRCEQAADIRFLRHPRKGLDLAPGGSPVLRRVNKPVVGPDEDQSLFPGRLRDRRAISVERGGCV